jgi:hypothetical protein
MSGVDYPHLPSSLILPLTPHPSPHPASFPSSRILPRIPRPSPHPSSRVTPFPVSTPSSLIPEMSDSSTRVQITKAGVSFGSALAIAISWSTHHSILWACIHGILSWLYVIYFALTR